MTAEGRQTGLDHRATGNSPAAPGSSRFQRTRAPETIRLYKQDWLRPSDTRIGPAFRKINRWGNLEFRRLGTDAIRRDPAPP